MRGVVARRVVGRRRSVHGRIRTIGSESLGLRSTVGFWTMLTIAFGRRTWRAICDR